MLLTCRSDDKNRNRTIPILTTGKAAEYGNALHKCGGLCRGGEDIVQDTLTKLWQLVELKK